MNFFTRFSHYFLPELRQFGSQSRFIIRITHVACTRNHRDGFPNGDMDLLRWKVRTVSVKSNNNGMFITNYWTHLNLDDEANLGIACWRTFIASTEWFLYHASMHPVLRALRIPYAGLLNWNSETAITPFHPCFITFYTPTHSTLLTQLNSFPCRRSGNILC